MKKMILVVDDYREIREVLKDFLEMSGYKVKVAEDGEVGLRLLQQGKFDLVITDIGMPQLRGDQMIAQYRGDVPIIVISGGEDDQKRARKLLADDKRVKCFLSKPIDFSKFLNEVKNIIEQGS